MNSKLNLGEPGMDKTIKTETNEKVVYEIVRTVDGITPASKSKIIKMQQKMRIAYHELRQNQQRLSAEHDSLCFARNEMRLWQDNYVSLFNQLKVGCFTIYKDLIIREVNNAGVEMLGYDRFEIIGNPFVVHAESTMRDSLRRYFNQVFEDKGQVSIKLNLITSNGSAMPVLIQSAMMEDSAGTTPCCLCSVMDMSQVHQLQNELKIKQNHIEQLAEKHILELNTVLKQMQEQAEIFEQNKTQWSDSRGEFESQIENYRNAEEQFEQEKIHLNVQLNDIQSAKDNLQRQCLDFESIIKEQTFELASLKGRLEKSSLTSKRFIELEKQFEEFKDESQQRQNQLGGQLQVSGQQLKELEHKSNLEKQQLQIMIKQRSRKISELLERIESIKTQYQQTADTLKKNLEDTERVLGGKVNELSIVNKKLQEQLSNSRQDGQQYRLKSIRLEKLFNQAQAELTVSQKELDIKNRKIEQIEKDYQTQRDELAAKLSEKSADLDLLTEAYQQQQIDTTSLSGKLEMQIKQNSKLASAIRHSKIVLQKLCDAGAITMNIYNLVERKNAYVNRHIGTVLGYSDEQITQAGNNFVAQIMHPDDLKRLREDLEGFSWDEHNEIVEVEYRLRDAKDNWRYIRSQEMAISVDEYGKVVEVLGIQYDYTEKMQARQGLEALAKIMSIAGSNS
jgi:PAS domain S-box-containing protein